jgi:perosamine synthetase
MGGFIPVNEPLLDGNEERYLVECIRSGWISSEGPFVSRFEEEFAARVGRRYGVSVTNGTAALDAAIVALGIGPGDEVILPTFTIISCVQQIVRSGATPVFVDSDPATWCMDVSLVEASITARTKAVMAVHIYGMPVDMDPLLQLAKIYDLRVIEDAAESIGGLYKGRSCGSFGDVSTVSFYANKHVTTGEGGMVLTDDAELAERLRSLRNLCFEKERFVHQELGWNLRMTNVQAAIGLAQLERLDHFVDLKRNMALRYRENLSATPNLRLPIDSVDYAHNVYWVFGILLPRLNGVDASGIAQRLASHGVGTRRFFFPLHRQPVLNRLGYGVGEVHPVANTLRDQGIYLPSGLALSMEQVDRVSEVLDSVLRELDVGA